MTPLFRAVVRLMGFSALSVLEIGSAKAQTPPGDSVLRATLPAEGPPPPLHLPPVQYRTLANGLRIALIERHDVPSVSVYLRFTVSPRDPIGREGLRSGMFSLLDAGTPTLSADQLADSTAALGGAVSPTGFTTIRPLFDRALAVMGEQLLHASFPEKELARWRKEQIGDLSHAEEQPDYWADRVFAARVYGPTHPYTRRPSVASLTAISRHDLIALHQSVVRPRNTTLIVAGDLTLDEAAAQVEHVFGGWTTTGAPVRVIPPPPLPPGRPAIYLYDRPGSAQSVIIVGWAGPRRDSPDYLAADLANTVLGGAFNSRLNLDLREGHGYTYGVSSGIGAREPPEFGVIAVQAAVATAKTDSAVVHLMQDIRDLTTASPVTDSELAFAKANAVKSLPLQFETTAAAAGGISEILAYHLPDDYFNTYTAKAEAVTLAAVRSAATHHFSASRAIIVIVGDRSAISRGLRASGIAPIIPVDVHGAPTGSPVASDPAERSSASKP